MMTIAEILDPTINPNAGIAYSIVKAGLPLGISSRGLGSVEGRDGVSIVQEDFEMVTFDLVSDPSTHGAYLRHFQANKLSEASENAADVRVDLERELKGWNLPKDQEKQVRNLLANLTIK